MNSSSNYNNQSQSKKVSQKKRQRERNGSPAEERASKQSNKNRSPRDDPPARTSKYDSKKDGSSSKKSSSHKSYRSGETSYSYQKSRTGLDGSTSSRGRNVSSSSSQLSEKASSSVQQSSKYDKVPVEKIDEEAVADVVIEEMETGEAVSDLSSDKMKMMHEIFAHADSLQVATHLQLAEMFKNARPSDIIRLCYNPEFPSQTPEEEVRNSTRMTTVFQNLMFGYDWNKGKFVEAEEEPIHEIAEVAPRQTCNQQCADLLQASSTAWQEDNRVESLEKLLGCRVAAIPPVEVKLAQRLLDPSSFTLPLPDDMSLIQ